MHHVVGEILSGIPAREALPLDEVAVVGAQWGPDAFLQRERLPAVTNRIQHFAQHHRGDGVDREVAQHAPVREREMSSMSSV